MVGPGNIQRGAEHPRRDGPHVQLPRYAYHVDQGSNRGAEGIGKDTGMNVPEELKQHLTADDIATLTASITFTLARIVPGSVESQSLEKILAFLKRLHVDKIIEDEISRN